MLKKWSWSCLTLLDMSFPAAVCKLVGTHGIFWLVWREAIFLSPQGKEQVSFILSCGVQTSGRHSGQPQTWHKTTHSALCSFEGLMSCSLPLISLLQRIISKTLLWTFDELQVFLCGCVPQVYEDIPLWWVLKDGSQLADVSYEFQNINIYLKKPGCPFSVLMTTSFKSHA